MNKAKEGEMDGLDTTIDLLKKIITDKNCENMNLSTVKGYLGELIVKRKLQDEGIKTNSKGNQSGYDLEYKDNDKDIRIDVKLSMLKNEFGLENHHWGWALKTKNKNKEITATHFVCAALNNELEVDAFYVINTKNKKYEMFPQGPSRFRNVEHSFGVYSSDLSDIINKEDIKTYFKQSMALMQDGYVIRVNPSENLSSSIK
jgi:hypothetical protein